MRYVIPEYIKNLKEFCLYLTSNNLIKKHYCIMKAKVVVFDRNEKCTNKESKVLL